MDNAVLQEGWLATSQESCIQAAKSSYIDSGVLQEGRFLLLRDQVFNCEKLRNV